MNGYEYQVIQMDSAGSRSVQSTRDPGIAGSFYRSARKQVEKWGGSAELQRRTVSAWETVESTSPLHQPGD